MSFFFLFWYHLNINFCSENQDSKDLEKWILKSIQKEEYIQISNPKREGHPHHHEPPRFAMKNRAPSIQDKSNTKTKDISYAERKIYKENVDLSTS